MFFNNKMQEVNKPTFITDKTDPLSNDYKSYVIVDNRPWKSATEYIYSNAFIGKSKELGTNLLRETAYDQNIVSKFNALSTQNDNEMIKTAAKLAMEAKFQNENLRRALSKTSGSFIYHSENALLGINPKGLGDNYIGLLLENIRSKIQGTRGTNLLYTVYLAMKALQFSIEKGIDVYEKYKSSSYEQIVQSYGEQKLLAKVAPKDVILKMFREGSLPELSKEIEHPGNLVARMAERGEKLINVVRIGEQNKELFEEYVEFIARKKFPTRDRNFIREQLGTLSLVEKEKLISKVADLYEMGAIPELKVKRAKLITHEYIFKEGIPPLDVEDIDAGLKVGLPSINIYVDPNSNPPELREFSPVSSIYPFKINNKVFPSVTLYIQLVHMCNDFEGAEFDAEYAKILSGSDFNTIQQFQNNNKRLLPAKQIMASAKKVLDVKFRQPFFYTRLLNTTGNIYYISKDKILGCDVKTHEGTNFVGKYLETLRDQLRAEEKKVVEGVRGLSKNIKELFTTEISQWYIKRLQNICNVAKSFSSYVKVPISTDMLTHIIYNYFKPCYTLGALNTFNAIEPVKEYIKSQNIVVDDTGANVIWSYILLSLYLLIGDEKLSEAQIEEKLKKYQEELTLTKSNDSVEHAIIKVLITTKALKTYYPSIPENYDKAGVDLALKIICNDITAEVTTPSQEMADPDLIYLDPELEHISSYITAAASLISSRNLQNRVNFYNN